MPKYKLKHGKYREANKTESGQLRRREGKVYWPGDIVELSEAQAERYSDMVEKVLEETPATDAKESAPSSAPKPAASALSAPKPPPKSAPAAKAEV